MRITNPLRSAIALGLMPGVMGFIYGSILVNVPAAGVLIGLVLFGLWIAWLLRSGSKALSYGASKPLAYTILMVVAICIIVVNFLTGIMGGMTGQALLSLKVTFFLGGASLILIALAELLSRPKIREKDSWGIEL